MRQIENARKMKKKAQKAGNRPNNSIPPAGPAQPTSSSVPNAPIIR